MRFDFSLPGSLQAFRVKAGEQDAVRLMQSEECFRSGSGALKILAATDAKSAPVKVYYQTYYHPDDFNDSRYDPSFSRWLTRDRRLLRFCVQTKRFRRVCTGRMIARKRITMARA